MHAPNSVISSQDFHIEFVKIVTDLKNLQVRIISKREISKRRGSTGAVLSKRKPVENGRVGTFFLV